MKKMLARSAVLALSLLFFSQSAFAGDDSIWVGWGVGFSYDEVTEKPHLYSSVKTVLFNFKDLGILGFGYGYATDLTIKTYNGIVIVPIRYGPITLEASWKKVWRTPDDGVSKKTRMWMLVLNKGW